MSSSAGTLVPYVLESWSMISLCFFNDTATTEIYPLPLHDALPIFHRIKPARTETATTRAGSGPQYIYMLASGKQAKANRPGKDRKSTRLNSSHSQISYAVFCLKKKKKRTEKYVNIDSK